MTDSFKSYAVACASDPSFHAPPQPARPGDARSIGQLFTQVRPRTEVPVLRYSYDTGDRRISRLLEKRLRCPKAASKLLRAFDALAIAVKCRGQRAAIFGRYARHILELMITQRIWLRGFDWTHQQIAERLNVSETTVQTEINRLRDAGFLSWVRRSRPTPEGVRQAANLYWLQVPKRLVATFGAAATTVQDTLRSIFALQPAEPMLAGLYTATQIAADRAAGRIPSTRSLAGHLSRLATSVLMREPEGADRPTPSPSGI